MQIEICPSLENIPHEQWQPLVPEDFPFVDLQFLLALEKNRCLGERTGWLPAHILCREGTQIAGALLIFAKTNSYGEYIFDFSWAHAFESHGLDYYPKSVSAIPFTPATGPKILLNRALNDAGRKRVAQRLLEVAQEQSRKNGQSSLHALFIAPDEIPYFREQKFMIRHSFQYHWLNEGYQSFEDFLSRLRSKRRKEILREREQVLESGIKIRRTTGKELTAEHAEIMFQFYSSTVEKMQGNAYLTREFFHQVFSTMKEKILFVVAETRSGEPVAGALNYFSGKTLFGRHWGCLEEYRSLHFEVCYYQGIEFAIEKELSLFEAGAQGEHKFQRGFLPRLTCSAHQIHHPEFSRAIGNFIENEKVQIAALMEAYEKQTPFSRAVL